MRGLQEGRLSALKAASILEGLGVVATLTAEVREPSAGMAIRADAVCLNWYAEQIGTLAESRRGRRGEQAMNRALVLLFIVLPLLISLLLTLDQCAMGETPLPPSALDDTKRHDTERHDAREGDGRSRGRTDQRAQETAAEDKRQLAGMVGGMLLLVTIVSAVFLYRHYRRTRRRWP